MSIQGYAYHFCRVLDAAPRTKFCNRLFASRRQWRPIYLV
jgi:hypothetical protein